MRMAPAPSRNAIQTEEKCRRDFIGIAGGPTQPQSRSPASPSRESIPFGLIATPFRSRPTAAADGLSPGGRGRLGRPRRPCTRGLSLAGGPDFHRLPQCPAVVPVPVDLKRAGKLGNPAFPGLQLRKQHVDRGAANLLGMLLDPGPI